VTFYSRSTRSVKSKQIMTHAHLH